MYLELDSLYNESRANAFSAGKKKYYDNAVSNITTAKSDGKFIIMGNVSGLVSYESKIVFDEMGGLYDYSCSCDSFNLSDGPCKHIVALALSFEEKNPSVTEFKEEKKTDSVALSLISEYGKKKQRKIMSDDDIKAEITPYLSIDPCVSLRFSIGRKKHYNVKDVAELVSNVKSCGYKRYGVDLDLIHIPNNFTPETNRLLDFLCAMMKEKADYGVSPLRYKDEMRLMTGDVDDFFEMYFNKQVMMAKDLPLTVCEEPIPVKLSVKNVEGGFEICVKGAKLKFISGKKYDYVCCFSKIHRITHAFSDTVKDFYDAIELKNKLFVSSADMTLFYNSVISSLSQFMEIETDSDLTAFEAEPLTCKIFVDAEGDEVKCSLQSSYGDVRFDLLSESFNGDVVRDWESENNVRGLLVKYFPDYPYLTLCNESDIFEFISKGIKELFAYCEVFIMDTMKKLSVRRPPKIRVGIRLSENLLNLNVDADGYTQEEVASIINAYREKKRYVRLGGGFVDLNDDSIKVLSEILENARAEGESFTMPAYYAPYVNDELKHGYFDLERDSSFKKLVRSLASIENEDIKCPESLEAVMRNYQKTGYRWLKLLKDNHFGGILADDMGLGKSLQIIALMQEQNSKSIVVCPTTLMLNWESEISKFAPSLKVLTVMGSYDERVKMIKTASNYDVVITSYDLIRRDVDLYENSFDYAIADEAQFIKNHETKNAIAVKKLKATHRFALTGTPIENHLGELWSIFDFVMPMYLGDYSTFKEKYEIGIIRKDADVIEKFKRVTRPFILRRIKSEVLKELPAKIETVIPTKFDDEQKKLYDANLASIKMTIANENGFNNVVVLSMLTKLRQICCDPSLVYPEYTGASAKVEACMQLVKTAVEGGHKILLFSQFTSMLDILRKRLSEEGVSYYSLRGETPKTERVKLVNRFNTDDTKVFLISLKAGGTGLNLTGADVVIHFDPWWNESVMNQATDRAYRIGQDKAVQVYKLIVKDTLEEKIMELQEKKSALSSLVVGKENGLKEIMQLLSNQE